MVSGLGCLLSVYVFFFSGKYSKSPANNKSNKNFIKCFSVNELQSFFLIFQIFDGFFAVCSLLLI
ncbi:hypothetical protein C4K38_2516 [Pseudomonas chlororaphis subsp. piscium]|nr:hypothetical protein C4K38_2516 [Pseudomonas chlororaphis subsp. piscium]AZC50126.1 hypothetical protein C4K35_2543 [Pseudomonas chlororaphis subsp. piscium]